MNLIKNAETMLDEWSSSVICPGCQSKWDVFAADFSTKIGSRDLYLLCEGCHENMAAELEDQSDYFWAALRKRLGVILV